MVDAFLLTMTDMEKKNIAYAPIQEASELFKIGNYCRMREFWDCRNAIGDCKLMRHIAYNCSPDSDAYWCS